MITRGEMDIFVLQAPEATVMKIVKMKFYRKELSKKES